MDRWTCTHTHSTLPPSLRCYRWAGHGAACSSRHVFSAWLISQGALVLQLLGGGSYFTWDMFRSYLCSQHDQNTVVYTVLCLALQGRVCVSFVCVCVCVRVCTFLLQTKCAHRDKGVLLTWGLFSVITFLGSNWCLVRLKCFFSFYLTHWLLLLF